jgi:hypothetical protein
MIKAKFIGSQSKRRLVEECPLSASSETCLVSSRSSSKTAAYFVEKIEDTLVRKRKGLSLRQEI